MKLSWEFCNIVVISVDFVINNDDTKYENVDDDDDKYIRNKINNIYNLIIF